MPAIYSTSLRIWSLCQRRRILRTTASIRFGLLLLGDGAVSLNDDDLVAAPAFRPERDDLLDGAPLKKVGAVGKTVENRLKSWPVVGLLIPALFH
jgi:hypothetical protein